LKTLFFFLQIILLAMAKVYLKQGDLTKSDATYLVHQCNCVTTRGMGLAYTMFKVFPQADVYSTRTKPSIPGNISVHGRVVNLYGQCLPGGPSSDETESMREEWFRQCLVELSYIVKPGDTIAMPEKIGCDLAKGNLNNYQLMIDNFASSLPSTCKVYLYRFDPKKG